MTLLAAGAGSGGGIKTAVRSGVAFIQRRMSRTAPSPDHNHDGSKKGGILKVTYNRKAGRAAKVGPCRLLIGGSGAHYRGQQVPIIGGQVPFLGGTGAHCRGGMCPL